MIVVTSSIVTSIVYLAGIYTYSKMIKISIKDKDMSWQLDIIFSCARVFLNTLNFVLFTVTYLEPNLHLYTGQWFCYASKLVSHYCNLIITAHTLIVAILKYVVIIYWQRAREIGHDKIKKLFSFIIALFYPISMFMIHFAVRPDFLWAYDGYKQVDMCLGDPKRNWEEGTNQTQTKIHGLCSDIGGKTSDNYFIYFFAYIFRTGVCWIQVVFIYVAFWNLLDAIVYFKIFSAMKR